MFQVVPPCGGHPGLLIWSSLMRGFKSCPRVGGIWRPPCPRGLHQCFKSCPRVGGIRTCAIALRPRILYQVVPPCGGHPVPNTPILIFLKVSSSAPVWGSSQTFLYVCSNPEFQVVPPCGGHPRECLHRGRRPVSSRAPVWGASNIVDDLRDLVVSFKSCPRVGGITLRVRRDKAHTAFQVVPPCGGHHQARSTHH